MRRLGPSPVRGGDVRRRERGSRVRLHEKNKNENENENEKRSPHLSRANRFGAFRYVGRVTRTETDRTHVHGFEPPVADGLEAELHGLLIPQAAEPLAVDVALVHEDVPFAVVSRHEACDLGEAEGERSMSIGRACRGTCRAGNREARGRIRSHASARVDQSGDDKETARRRDRASRARARTARRANARRGKR